MQQAAMHSTEMPAGERASDARSTSESEPNREREWATKETTAGSHLLFNASTHSIAENHAVAVCLCASRMTITQTEISPAAKGFFSARPVKKRPWTDHCSHPTPLDSPSSAAVLSSQHQRSNCANSAQHDIQSKTMVSEMATAATDSDDRRRSPEVHSGHGGAIIGWLAVDRLR